MTSTSPDLDAVLLRGSAADTAATARFDDTQPHALGLDSERRRVLRRASDRAVYDAASSRSFTEAVAEAREAAHAEGRAAGHTEGLAAAAADIRRRHDDLLAAHRCAEREREAAVSRAVSALTDAADGLRNTHVTDTNALLKLAVDIAIELAEALVSHDLAVRASPGLDAIHRVLAMAPDPVSLRIRLHPTDAAALGDAAITVVVDNDIAPGDCIAEVDGLEIDGSVRAALARAREVLSG